MYVVYHDYGRYDGCDMPFACFNTEQALPAFLQSRKNEYGLAWVKLEPIDDEILSDYSI